jgi:hypothetical protein
MAHDECGSELLQHRVERDDQCGRSVLTHIANASGSGLRKQSAAVDGGGLLAWSAGAPMV